MDENALESSALVMAEDEGRRLDGYGPPASAGASDDLHRDDDDDRHLEQHDDQPNRMMRAPENDEEPCNPGAKGVDSCSDDAAAAHRKSLQATKSRETTKGKNNKVPRNELTHLIPGYTAPMALNSSSLDKYRPPGGLEAIRQQALAKDHPIKSASTSIRRTRAVSGLGGGSSGGTAPTPSKDWFRSASTPVTEQLKKDLQLLRNRNYLDPKRFYKKSNDPVGRHVQVGTVLEGATEFYSSRLTKKQRRTNLLDEVLADADASTYARNKYRTMQRDKTAQAQARRTFKRRGPQKRR